MSFNALPAKQGLYDPKNEHDACGVGFIAHIRGQKSHDIICKGLEILKNIDHRGAVGADPLAGDGAGILIQTPDAFLRAEAAALGVTLPEQGQYGVGMLFLPRNPGHRAACEKIVEDAVRNEGQTLLGWRDVPVDNAGLGETVKAIEPFIRQVFVGRGENCKGQDGFERKLFVIRKQIDNKIRDLDISEGRMF